MNTKSAVMTIANSIYYKVGSRTRSEALKAAWRLVKEGWMCKVEGTAYNQSQKAIAQINAGAKTTADIIELKTRLGRQLNVRLYMNGGAFNLGFLPLEVAAVLKPIFHKGLIKISGLNVIGGGTSSFGAKVKISLVA